jgi:hypothetical protein
MKPVLLDLFCRMGGATVGYQRAGFHVIGVDIEPQPGYPGDEFIKMDAILVLRLMLEGPRWLGRIALVHASPPCQEGNTATAGNRARGITDQHVQLVPPTRDLLQRIGVPYVIEQPTSSRKGLIRRDLTLCMDMFKGDMPPPWIQKHRSFELSGFTVPQPAHRKHEGYVRGHRHGLVRRGAEAPYVACYGNGGGKATAAEAAHAMQIGWMQRKATERENAFDLYEAIPPAYTEFIGAAFLAHQAVTA